MLLTQILTIVELSLRLALKIAEDMPPELRQAFWKQHAENMAFWQGVADKVKGQAA